MVALETRARVAWRRARSKSTAARAVVATAGWISFGVDLFGIGEHAVDVSELTICIVLQDGRAYVGTIEHQHRGGIILHLLGGRSVRIGFRSIRRASLLGSHTFEERRIVCRRQACGLPAAVFPIAAKTISQDAFSDPAST